MKKGEWIAWDGQSDVCPVPVGTDFEFRLRAGDLMEGGLANSWAWGGHLSANDIVAYRLINLKEDAEVLTDDQGNSVFNAADYDLRAAKSDGSTASYHELPEGATELQHLISDRDMNAQMGEIFRATYRYGRVAHSEKLRDAKKIKYYAEAEIARLEKLEGNKDV